MASAGSCSARSSRTRGPRDKPTCLKQGCLRPSLLPHTALSCPAQAGHAVRRSLSADPKCLAEQSHLSSRPLLSPHVIPGRAKREPGMTTLGQAPAISIDSHCAALSQSEGHLSPSPSLRSRPCGEGLGSGAHGRPSPCPPSLALPHKGGGNALVARRR